MAFAGPRKLLARVPWPGRGATGRTSVPDCIVLSAPEGQADPAPVRIYVGTEQGQYRAERVLLWSICKVRNPAREYRIYLMRDLDGFDRRRWLTGFTNYRFAIPTLAGGSGRAIYNDVDQIYLADPAELFDLPMDDHGALALTPFETSVMLLDCARTAPLWPLRDAQSLPRKALEARLRSTNQGFGALPARWHARDHEYAAGVSALVHYTTLHTQPWQPLPEQFVYRRNRCAGVWEALEQEADAAGFEVYGPHHPSGALRALRARLPVPEQPQSCLPSASGLRRIGLYSGQEGVDTGLLDANGEAPSSETVHCVGALAYLPAQDIPWALRWLLAQTRKELRIDIDERAAPALPGWQAQRRGLEWYSALLTRLSGTYPGVHWELNLRGRRPAGRAGGAIHPAPLGWILDDAKPGHLTQSLGLANALGWPTTVKQLRFNAWSLRRYRFFGSLGSVPASLAGVQAAARAQLAPPWPDLVIVTGWRGLPAARWIHQRSGGHTRIVTIGRHATRRPDYSDVGISAGYFCLPWHPRRLEVAAPLTRMDGAVLASARERYAHLLAQGAAPRIVALVGGASRRFRLDADAARALGGALLALRERLGGSLHVVTSRRTGAAATQILQKVLGGAAQFELWRPDQPDNPYAGYLAWADHLVVTGESESMLAEAAATGKPIHIYPLPELARRTHLADRLLARALHEPLNKRGTPRPQQGLEYLCARLLQRGVLSPRRDLSRLHQDLVARGQACLLGGPAPQPGSPLDESPEVARQLPALLGLWAAPEGRAG